MITTTYVCDPRPDYSLQVTGIRCVDDFPGDTSDGYTLIFLHAMGVHKETWQPAIERLLQLSSSATTTGNPFVIREAWSIECPNHGESAVLNEKDLQERFPSHWTGYEYPRAAHAFLTSSPGGVDFAQHKLIGVGHSMGGNALVLLQSFVPLLTFEAIILLDATIGGPTPERDRMNYMLTQIAWLKQDVWSSRKTALKDLSSQPGFKNWDKSILDLFIEKALRVHPASKYPEPYAFNGVTLACSRALEAASYRGDDHHPRAFEMLKQLYAKGPPVHCIFSRGDEFGGSKLKEAQILDIAKGQPASVRWIEKGGHMFVQQQPKITAETIWGALQEMQFKVMARL